MIRRHRNNPPVHTEYTKNYWYVITEVTVSSCTQADRDGLSSTPIHVGMQFIHDYEKESFVTLDIFFFVVLSLSLYGAVLWLSKNEIEECITCLRGEIFTVARDEPNGLFVLFRGEIHLV